ncbi:MAG: NAD(P)-dependent oxidoreductase [Marinosulfonomonas sp.]|nr:NAD(P)-dependent oxidoreductase [Marinosulfonomonas sp.]
MNKRILVTGATGLIGRHAVNALLDRGHEVVGFSRSELGDPRIRTIAVDLLDPTARLAAIRDAKATHLLHLAWHDDPRDRWASQRNHDWATVTAHIVREFSDLGGERVVCAGSCAEYDWSYEVMTETTPLRPATVYGQAKAETGKQLLTAAPGYGMSLLWARLFFCYGPLEPRGRLLGDLLYGLSAGKPIPCTDGQQERDYLHSADVGEALAIALESDVEGAVNIASGNATKVRDIIQTTAALMGRPELVSLIPREHAPNDPPRLVADISRLQSLGFEAKFDLNSGLRQCVDALEKRIAGDV